MRLRPHTHNDVCLLNPKEITLTTHPDIVFLVLDTQRVDRLSCYEYAQETSPHLDAIAADATLFRRAYSTAQWTVPSHSSMFTGVYPSVHRTQHSDSILPRSLPTLAERLRAGGYFTAAYCNNPLVGVVNNGLRRGFYSFLNYSGWLSSRPNQAGMPLTLFGRYRQGFKRLLAGALNRAQDSFARSDFLLWFAFTPLMVPFWQTALSFKGNTAKSLSDAADLLVNRRGVKEGQPIFSFINLMGTHAPYHPQRRYIERFAPDVVRDAEARKYLRRFNGDVFGWLAPIADTMPEQHKSTLDGIYNAEVANQDEHLGTFFNRLRESGALDRTLFVICADHGEHLGEKQLIGHSFSVYNELTHVPLIIRDPSDNFPRQTAVDHPVSLRRLFHTVLTAAGMADDTEEKYALQRSPESDPDGGVVFAEGVPSSNVLHLVKKFRPELVRERRYDLTRRAVIQGADKLILTGNERRELYDVVQDPAELHNLSAQETGRVDMLRERILQFESDMADAALTAGRISAQDDPQLRRQLRALGYLE